MDKRDTTRLPSKGQVLRVLYNFQGDADRKLTMRAGETVTFLELAQGGWARGFDSRGRNGFFPFAFCGPLKQEEEDDTATVAATEVDSLIDSLQKSGPVSGESEAKRLAVVPEKKATVSYEVVTKVVKRSPPTESPPTRLKLAPSKQVVVAPEAEEKLKTSPREIAKPEGGAGTAPHSPPPVPPPASVAAGRQADNTRQSEFVAYSTAMLPPPADPLANVMSELQKKNWKIGTTRNKPEMTGTIRINSLELRIKQLEQENKLLLSRLGKCGVCESDKLVCLVCEARREKPLPMPRDSTWQTMEEVANTAKPLPVARDSASGDFIGVLADGAERDLELEDLQAHISASNTSPNPLKKPLPIPRDTMVADTRESIWFFADDAKKK